MKTTFLGLIVSVFALFGLVVACGAPAPTSVPAASTEQPPTTAPIEKEPTAAPIATVASPEPVTFVYALQNIAATMDDQVDGNNPSGMIMELCYDSLVEYELGTTTIVPQLATDWSVSPDNLTYTFHLRKGVKFHDGSDFDAQDVKASLDRVMTLNLGVAYNLASVKEVRIVDPYTVEIELKDVYAPFLGGLVNIAIYSGEAIQEHSAEGTLATDWFANHEMGTGPYKMVSFTPGQEATFTRFEDYWQGWDGKHLDTVVFRLVAEAATQRMLIESGEVHMTNAQFTSDDLEGMETNPDLQVVEGISIRQFAIILNTNKGALQDKRVRQAILYSWDRETFCNDILNGHCEVPVGLVAKFLPEFNSSMPAPEFNLEKAAVLLDEAGWKDTDGDGIRDKDGQPLKLEIMYLQSYEWQRMSCELLQSDLATIGVQLELTGQPWATMAERFVQPDIRPDGGYVGLYATTSSQATTYLWGPFHSNSGNYQNFGFSDPYVDSLLEQAVATLDADARAKIIQELDAYLTFDAVPAVSTMNAPLIHVARSEVKGFVFQLLDPAIPPVYNMYIEP